MRILVSTAAMTAMALALAACGGSADDSDDMAGDDTAVIDDVSDMEGDIADEGDDADAADDAEDTGEGAETDGEESEGDEPDTAASPTPTPSATATTAAAAAATPPPMFALCSACHSVKPGENGIGPSLAGVFGAKAGHVSSFDYSDAMAGSGLTWDQATLNRYLENPQGVVPGTSMSYGGLKNADQRKAVVDYLKTL